MSELLPFPPVEAAEEVVKLSDAEARRRALDVRLSAIVEAPAGSGKTGLLLQRYLKLLAEGGVSQPEEVLAMTFTRKATAELRERVVEQLRAAAAKVSLAEDASSFERETRALAEAVLRVDARMGWHLLEQPQRLRIRTIDALCAEIAQTLPLLSGAGTSQPVDSAESLYHEAARRTLMELGGADDVLNDAVRTVLLHRDGNILECEALLARMLEQRQQWGELVPLHAARLTEEYLDEQIRPKLERTLETIICATLARAVEAVPAPDLAKLSELSARFAFAPSYDPDKPSPLSVWANRSDPPEARAEDLPYWVALLRLLFTRDGDWRKRFRSSDLKFDIAYEDRDVLSEIVERIQSDELGELLKSILHLPPAHFPEDQWRVAKALFRLLRHSLAHLKVIFAETRRCDFAEFSLAACEALAAEEGAADLARSPGARLTHLLVDEMQDTSLSQYTLLERLTRSWDGHSQTVFLVGDPKQSIYLFRQSRVERFLRTVAQRRLGDVPLEALQLTANFRSQAALVHGFNESFAQIFPQQTMEARTAGEELQVPFVHASPVRPDSMHPRAIAWHTEVLGEEAASSAPRALSRELRAARVEREAREIRSVIEEWRSRPLPSGRTKPWSIAVLARARKHLTAITAELSRDYGSGPIPFRAVDIDTLNERPEVLDALALTRALLHPADRVAWLAVLRAPWCGLSLVDLLCLTGEVADTDSALTIAELVETRAVHLSSSGQELLGRAWPTLAEAMSLRGTTSFATHVERTWLSLGGDAALSADRLANVRRFFALLREAEQDGGGFIDGSALAEKLESLYAETAPDEDAVQLLTIHNSKGLEYDVVLIPGLQRAPNRSRSELLNWLELDSADGDAAHILLAPIASRGEKSDGLTQWLAGVRHSRENAEVGRLLYVGCTRAREALHLFAACETRNDGSIRIPTEGTLLRAAWPVAAAQFETAVAAGTTPLPMTPAPRGNNLLPFASTDNNGTGLALAAAADEVRSGSHIPVVHRLPRDFDPVARFTSAANRRLPYTPAEALPSAPAFDRPQGSFAVRAFGNVVHRFLQFMSIHLDSGKAADEMATELAAWEPRIAAALRNEGLAAGACAREAPRVLDALRKTLQDPVGKWILSRHASGTSEYSMASADSSILRADRTFLAGSAPLADGRDCIWIIDFKTTVQGSLSPERFEQDELLKYREQLERYAEVTKELAPEGSKIMLGLYYPLIPHLLHWTF